MFVEYVYIKLVLFYSPNIGLRSGLDSCCALTWALLAKALAWAHWYWALLASALLAWTLVWALAWALTRNWPGLWLGLYQGSLGLGSGVCSV